MKTIAIATAAAALINLTVSLDVLAENGHAYNGSYCTPYFGSQSSSFNQQPNGIRNVSGGSRYVSCPIIVDQIANTAGTTKTYVHYTGNGSISCLMSNKNGNGTTRQTRAGSRVGTGWIINFGVFTSDDYWGSYSMYCLLPAGGTLNTIWVGEKG